MSVSDVHEEEYGTNPFSWPMPREPTISITGSTWSTMSAGVKAVLSRIFRWTHQESCAWRSLHAKPDKIWLHSTESAEEDWSLDDIRYRQDLGAGEGACQSDCEVKIVLFTHFLLTSQFVGTFPRVCSRRIDC